MDPKDRLTGIKALTHPYFDDVRFKDDEFYKITEGDDLSELENREVTRPIQSSQGLVNKLSRPSFDGRHRNINSRAGVTAYSGFESSMKEFPFKKKKKKGNKARKLDSIYGKKSLYDIKNVSIAQFTEKSSTFGKQKHSNGTLRNKEFLNIYGNEEMTNTQYTSRNDEANVSSSFINNNNKKKGHLYKGISNSKSTVGAAFPTQLSTHKLNDSHEYNYDISTPISNSILRTSPFNPEQIGNIGNNHNSKETFHNNIIMEDEKEVNYSSSNYSSRKKTERSKERNEGENLRHTESTQLLNEEQKEKSFNKDLIMQMKEKIK